MTDAENWMERFYGERAAHKALAATMFERTKAAIIPHLASAGIAIVELGYDGMGDSGCVEQPDYFGLDNQPLAAPEIDLEVEEIRRDTCVLVSAIKPICEALTDLAYESLAVHHPGWENNEGAFGTFRIDVNANTMTLCCNLRTSEYFENAIAGEV